MLAAKSPRLGTLPTCKRLWPQSGSSSMTGGIICTSILSVHSGKTFVLAMSSTVQPRSGKNRMFTKGFVPATSPWVGNSSTQSSAEEMGTAGTTLFLPESAFVVDRFVPTQQCMLLSFSSGVQHTSFISVNDIGICQYLYETLPATWYSICTHCCMYTLMVQLMLLLFFLTFNVLVANPKRLFHTVTNPARMWFAEHGKENKRKSLAAHPPNAAHSDKLK